MVAGKDEPMAKRAKADEEEARLVRRREELVRLLEEARAKGNVDARAKKELVTLCADFETKNEKLLRRLPPELWSKILDENVQQNDLFALAMTCRFFREKQKDLGKKMETDLNMYRLHKLLETGKVAPHTLGWFQWVCDNWEMYKADLLNYAALQGSVEILRWLLEEKGWELNKHTDLWAGFSGSTEVLEYLRGRGYKLKEACEGAAMGGSLKALKYLRGLDPPCPWNVWTCEGAARRGHLEVLKWLRAQNPPCPWDEWTCWGAASGGRLEILKWARSQDPPCPWNEDTCSGAAEEGCLEVLKWARSQDPPCPWSKSHCRWEASENDHQHIVDWIDQREDESDVEY